MGSHWGDRRDIGELLGSPRWLTKEDLAEVDQVTVRERTCSAFTGRGSGFHRIKRGPWENEGCGDIFAECSSCKKADKGQDVIWCLREHLAREHPESTIYWVLVLASTILPI